MRFPSGPSHAQPRRAKSVTDMKTRIPFALACYCLAAAGAPAETMTVEQIVALALKDPKTAPLVVEYAVEDNPRLTLAVVAATVKALPEEAPAIVGALMKAVFKQQAAPQTEQQKRQQADRQKEILRTAIAANPALAPRLAEMALTMFPAQSAEFLQVALEATPAPGRAAILALSEKQTRGNEPAGAAGPASGPRPPAARPGGFPAQPIRPDLVSPSN